MRPATVDALAARLSGFDTLVEIAVGHRTDLAAALSRRGVAVTATDVVERPTPDGVAFARDDVTDPTRRVYADAGALYALSLPPELHRPALALAQSVDAELLFTTLGGDPPLIPVDRETLPGTVLFRAETQPP